MKIYYWADACWCYDDEMIEMTHKGGDFGMLTLSPCLSEAEIDAAVYAALGG